MKNLRKVLSEISTDTLWRAVAVTLYVIGHVLVTLGVAELTTRWIWPISIGVLLITVGGLVAWSLASELKQAQAAPKIVRRN